MKRFLGIFMAIIIFVACGESKPEGIFSVQKMTDVLYDLHLADGYINSLPLDSIEKKNVNVYLSIYKRYLTDSLQVRENLNYYASRPQELEDIYAEISKRLKNEESTFRDAETEKYRENFKRDSIAKQRELDKFHLLQRDSVIHFIGTRDLFVSKDSLGASTPENTILQVAKNQQRRWENIFYYFEHSDLKENMNLLPVGDPSRKPKTPLKKPSELPEESNGKPIPN